MPATRPSNWTVFDSEKMDRSRPLTWSLHPHVSKLPHLLTVTDPAAAPRDVEPRFRPVAAPEMSVCERLSVPSKSIARAPTRHIVCRAEADGDAMFAYGAIRDAISECAAYPNVAQAANGARARHARALHALGTQHAPRVHASARPRVAHSIPLPLPTPKVLDGDPAEADAHAVCEALRRVRACWRLQACNGRRSDNPPRPVDGRLQGGAHCPRSQPPQVAEPP